LLVRQPWTYGDVVFVFAVLTATALFGPMLTRLALREFAFHAALLTLQALVTLGTIYWLLWSKYRVPVSVLGFDKNAVSQIAWPLTVIFGVTSVVGVLWCLLVFIDRPIFDWTTLPGSPRQGSRLEALGRLPASVLPMAILYYLAVMFLMPLMEEVLFRGFACAPFSRRLGKPIAAAFAAGLWALFHQLTPTRVLFTTLVGLIYAYLYQRTQSLLPSLTFHVAANTLISLGWLLSDLDRADRLVLPATVTSCVLLALCLSLLQSRQALLPKRTS